VSGILPVNPYVVNSSSLLSKPYIAFPLAASLKKKGARTANMVIFLSAWACIKLPQELVELRFLGPRFMAARLVLTIGFVIIMSLAMEAILKKDHPAEQT
jgi:uncharacterized membrane protein YraQ (UPF0718 family)